MFWMSQWECWVHTAGCQPCTAMEGEDDPTELRCRYCDARVQPDGGGRLWEFTNGGHAWVHTGRTVAQGSVWSGGWEYADRSYSDKCPVSPTFRHEFAPLRSAGVRRELDSSQAS
jgi:hypothetical protein